MVWQSFAALGRDRAQVPRLECVLLPVLLWLAAASVWELHAQRIVCPHRPSPVGVTAGVYLLFCLMPV